MSLSCQERKIQSIVDDLFVGNRLAMAEIATKDGASLDLRPRVFFVEIQYKNIDSPCAKAKSAKSEALSMKCARYQTEWEENYGHDKTHRAQDRTHCPQDRAKGGAHCPQDGTQDSTHRPEDRTHCPQDGTEGSAHCSQDGTEGSAHCSQDGTEGSAHCSQDAYIANC
jgi:hypothetical protein